MVIAARITYAHAADRHGVGWVTEILVAVTSPRAGLHHVDHRAALVEATQVNGAEPQWLESQDVAERSLFRSRAARNACYRPDVQFSCRHLPDRDDRSGKPHSPGPYIDA